MAPHMRHEDARTQRPLPNHYQQQQPRTAQHHLNLSLPQVSLRRRAQSLPPLPRTPSEQDQHLSHLINLEHHLHTLLRMPPHDQSKRTAALCSQPFDDLPDLPIPSDETSDEGAFTNEDSTSSCNNTTSSTANITTSVPTSLTIATPHPTPVLTTALHHTFLAQYLSILASSPGPDSHARLLHHHLAPHLLEHYAALATSLATQLRRINASATRRQRKEERVQRRTAEVWGQIDIDVGRLEGGRGEAEEAGTGRAAAGMAGRWGNAVDGRSLAGAGAMAVAVVEAETEAAREEGQLRERLDRECGRGWGSVRGRARARGRGRGSGRGSGTERGGYGDGTEQRRGGGRGEAPSRAGKGRPREGRRGGSSCGGRDGRVASGIGTGRETTRWRGRNAERETSGFRTRWGHRRRSSWSSPTDRVDAERSQTLPQQNPEQRTFPRNAKGRAALQRKHRAEQALTTPEVQFGGWWDRKGRARRTEEDWSVMQNYDPSGWTNDELGWVPLEPLAIVPGLIMPLEPMWEMEEFAIEELGLAEPVLGGWRLGWDWKSA